jgi:addiction module HigA family antidote
MLLEEFLKPLGMTQVALARRVGVTTQRINEIVRGKRGVSADTALRLERVFGMEAQFWLNLQMTWDLYNAMHSTSAKRIRQIKAVKTGAAA